MQNQERLTKQPIVRWRVIGITVVTTILSLLLPVGAAILSIVVLSNATIGLVFGERDYPQLASEFLVYDFVIPLIMPTMLGATFWWATRGLRRAPFAQVFAATSWFALGFVILGTLIGALSQALAYSLMSQSTTNYFGAAAIFMPAPTSSVRPNYFEVAINHWFILLTGWLPAVLALLAMALIVAFLGTVLAQSQARWQDVRVSLAQHEQTLSRSGGIKTLVVMATVLALCNVAYVVLFARNEPITEPFYLSVILGLILLPAGILCSIAAVQTLRLRRLVSAALPSPIAHLQVPTTDDSADGVVFSIGRIDPPAK